MNPVRPIFSRRSRVAELLNVVCLLLGPVAYAAAPSNTVQVRVEAPRMESQSFPAGQPPAHLKSLGGLEAGFCRTEISCGVRLEAESVRSPGTAATATVTSVAFTVGANITISVEEGAPPEILRHEEAHRAISLHYYDLAYAVARRLGERTLGRKLSLPGPPSDSTLEGALRNLQPQLIAEFNREVYDRSEFAQNRFDAITDHSRKNIPNDVAMARALREEEEHWQASAGQ